MPGPQPSILKMRSGVAAVAAGNGPGWVSAAVAAPQSCDFSPMGRYFIVRATNADGANAQGAGAFVQLCAYPVV